MVTNIKVLPLKPSQKESNVDKLAQVRIFGGLKAINSLTLFDDGSYSGINFAYFEQGDLNRILNQFNAPPGMQIDYAFQDNGTALTQVNAAGETTQVNITAFPI